MNFLNTQIKQLVNDTIKEAKEDSTSLFGISSPEIYFHDKFGSISMTSSAIAADKIILSESYCQLLWLMCYCAIKKADYDISYKRLNEETESSKQKFYKFIYTDCEDDDKPINFKAFPEFACKFKNSGIQTIGQLKIYLRQVIEIPQEIIYTFLKILAQKRSSEIPESGLNNFDLSKLPYYDEINIAFKYSLKFILYHELSHISLKHDLENDGSIKDEKEADYSAFKHLTEAHKGTNEATCYIGVICALTSLFFINPRFEEDEIHPIEYRRLFEYYDEYINYGKKEALLTYLLQLWANTCEIEKFPTLQDENSKYIQEVKNFFNVPSGDTHAIR